MWTDCELFLVSNLATQPALPQAWGTWVRTAPKSVDRALWVKFYDECAARKWNKLLLISKSLDRKTGNMMLCSVSWIAFTFINHEASVVT